MYYSALTSNQRKQVTQLFADELFGSDATAHLYELDKNGDVIGRTMIKARKTTKTKQVTRCKVTVRAAYVSDRQIQTARMHMDALAASTAHKLTFEEVTTS